MYRAKKLESIRLNDEQKKLVEDNMALVHLVIHRYWGKWIGDEDLLQEGYIGLCLAAYNYDASKGAFTTLACYTIRNQIRAEFRRRCTKKNTLAKVSLDDPIRDQDALNTTLTIADTVDVGNSIYYVDLEYFYSKTDSLDRNILSRLQDGKSQCDVASELNVSQSCISKRIRRMKRILEEAHE